MPELTNTEKKEVEAQMNHDKRVVEEFRRKMNRLAELRKEIATQRAKNAGLAKMEMKLETQNAFYQKLKDYMTLELSGCKLNRSTQSNVCFLNCFFRYFMLKFIF